MFSLKTWFIKQSLIIITDTIVERIQIVDALKILIKLIICNVASRQPLHYHTSLRNRSSIHCEFLLTRQYIRERLSGKTWRDEVTYE